MTSNAHPVVVTGANGFVGHALCMHFAAVGRAFRALVRTPVAPPTWGTAPTVVGDLAQAPERDLDAALEGAFAVVHLAGRAHVMRDRSASPRDAYQTANVTATERVLAAAVRAGVERFVLASTVKVCGERTAPGHPFGPSSPQRPQGGYAQSKAEAECIVLDATARDALAGCVLRLPLIYGPRVRANFGSLLDVVARERWLPLGGLKNARSLVYLGNLAEAIDATLTAPAAVTGIHHVADAQSVSTTRLIEAMAAALGTRARLAAVPRGLLRLAGTLAWRRDAVARLVESLEVDTASFRAATGWHPRYTLDDGLAATAAWWKLRHSI